MCNKYMDLAYEEAIKAYSDNEVPVGAVVVRNGEVIAKTHNSKLKTNNIMNHAEIIALIETSNILGDWRLSECEMYITLEPCPMCAGAIQQSRIRKVYIGTKSNVSSNEKIIKTILQNKDSYHVVDIEYLNDSKCSSILTRFFTDKR